MTTREYSIWMQYREKYGPLNPVRMYDRGAAIVASQVNNAHGGKAKPNDFISYGIEQTDGDMNEEQFIAALGGGAKIGR